MRGQEVIAGRKYYDRVVRGKQIEAQIIDALRDRFSLSIQSATEEQDREKKIDGWISMPDWSLQSLQVKYRETGTDLLLNLYEPFYGLADPRTKLARDRSQQHVDWYAFLVGKALHLIFADCIYKTIDNAFDIWRSRDWILLHPYPDKQGCPQFNSTAGVLMLKQDHYSGRPKLLLHIDPYNIPEPSRRTIVLDTNLFDSIQSDRGRSQTVRRGTVAPVLVDSTSTGHPKL